MPKELFGQFLTRRGMVRQQDIDEALLLQEVLGDSLAASALARDLITFQDVGRALERMDQGRLDFAGAALELRLLTREQTAELRQDGDHRFRLGELLVATTRLSQGQLEEELAHFTLERLLVSGPNVTKAGLVERIARATGLERVAVKPVLESILEAISGELAGGGSVTIKGFGTFITRSYPARRGINPRTRGKISIPRRRTAVLRYARKLRNRVNKGGC